MGTARVTPKVDDGRWGILDRPVNISFLLVLGLFNCLVYMYGKILYRMFVRIGDGTDGSPMRARGSHCLIASCSIRETAKKHNQRQARGTHLWRPNWLDFL
jgi:hypothetical protein